MVRFVVLPQVAAPGLGLLLAWIIMAHTLLPQQQVHAAPGVLWVPITGNDCKATCKAYKSKQQPLVTYTPVTAGTASVEGLLAICGLDLATPADTWLPGKKLPSSDDPACYYFNTTLGETAMRDSGFVCLCAPGAASDASIINWVAGTKLCGAGSTRFPPTMYSICRGSAVSGDFRMIPGFLHPNSNRCSTGMGETDAYEVMCLKTSRVSCYGKPKMLVQKAKPWPISCDGTVANKTCRTTCQNGGVFKPPGSLTGTSKLSFTSKCLPNGHWQTVSGKCQPAQAVACEKVPNITLSGLKATWPRGGCNNTAVNTICASECLDGYVSATATPPMAICTTTAAGAPQWELLPAINATNITGCVADPCLNITCAQLGPCQLPGICNPTTATCLPGRPFNCSEAFQMPSGSNITVTSTITSDTVSTTVTSADGTDVLRTIITPAFLGIEFSPIGSQEKLKGSINLTAEANLTSTYAANKLAVFLVAQLQQAWRFINSTESTNSRKLLDGPGCDNVPNEVETCCVLGCCAVHDECFRRHQCTAASWLPIIRKNNDASPACIECNHAVAKCILYRCIGPGDPYTAPCYGACPNNPSKAVYYFCQKEPGAHSDDSCNCDCSPPCLECCGSTCVGEICCPDAQVCGTAPALKRQCCSPGQVCRNGICCSDAQLCGTAPYQQCCSPDQVCRNGVCCGGADGPPLCGDACCLEGETCMGSLTGSRMCCPVGSSGICNGQCCNAGELCVEGNTRCCPTANVCGDACGCPDGQVCQQGRCVQGTGQPCGSMIWCGGTIGRCCQPYLVCENPGRSRCCYEYRNSDGTVTYYGCSCYTPPNYFVC